jgi:FAD-linked oxidoreductase
MNHFQNWGKTLRFKPQYIEYPINEGEVKLLVKRAYSQGKTIRVVGSGHSWTPLIESEDILVSLDKMQGLIKADPEKSRVKVWAGTKLKTLGKILHQQGLAMENLGDIDVQSIAGALSTGTHGTGIDFGTLATQLVEISFVNGKGDLITCNKENDPDLFRAAQISLGALGIITSYTIQAVPAYVLAYQARKADLNQTLTKLDEYKKSTRNFEFYWFPYTKTVQLKFLNRSSDRPQTGLWRKFNQSFLENGVAGFLSRVTAWFPALAATTSRIFAAGIGSEKYVNYSYKVFATQRNVRFYEMEYNIPAEKFAQVLLEIEECILKNRFRVHFPIECRFVKADDIMISPARERESAYIAVHMYRGMPYNPYFEAIEKIFRQHGGRPHYGKMNTCTYADFKNMYVDWDKFIALRDELDPEGVFLNDYLRGIFGKEKKDKFINP